MPGIRAAARAAGVTPHAIEDARSAGRIPDPATTAPEVVAQEFAKSTIQRNPEFHAARVRREQIDADLKQQKYDAKAGRLISVDEFESRMSQLCSDIRTAFMGLGSALAPMLEGQSAMRIKKEIDDAVAGHLTILAKARE